jgi:hypothetical protein
MKTVHGKGKNVHRARITDTGQSREHPEPVSTTRSKTPNERTPKERQHSLLVEDRSLR